jgi:hypothetical protein
MKKERKAQTYMIDNDVIVKLSMLVLDKKKKRLASEPATSASDIVNIALEAYLNDNIISPETMLDKIKDEEYALIRIGQVYRVKSTLEFVIDMFKCSKNLYQFHLIFKPLLENKDWEKKVLEKVAEIKQQNLFRSMELERLINLRDDPNNTKYPMDLPAFSER